MRGRGALLLLAALAIALAGSPATAQDTPFAPPEVMVDLSVIDALPGIGQVNRGRRIVLHPPREAGASTPMREAAATPPRPAAPPKPAKPAVAPKPPKPPQPPKSQTTAVARNELTPPAAPPEVKPETPPPTEAAAPLTPPSPPPPVKTTEVTPPPPVKPVELTPPSPLPEEKPKPAAAPDTATPGPAPEKLAANTPPTSPKPATPAVKPATAVPPPTVAPMPSGIVAPLRVAFSAGTADLSDANKQMLDSIAKSLTADEQRRVQLVAYASGGTEEANQARRLSLSRALNVRAYLIDRGVRNTRMDVRALGNRPDAGDPPDRVDIIFLER